jgi:hypothetical protein
MELNSISSTKSRKKYNRQESKITQTTFPNLKITYNLYKKMILFKNSFHVLIGFFSCDDF